MSVVGKTARGRTYTRKFDYEEAQRRYAAGEKIQALAVEYGVSNARVNQVVNPEVGRKAKELSAAYRWHCPECGAETRHKNARCNPCAALALTTTALDGKLHCSKCEQWLSPEMFSTNRTEAKYSRENRRRICRKCDTKARADYRQRNREREKTYSREYKRKRAATR